MKIWAIRFAYCFAVVALTVMTTLLVHYITPISANRDMSYSDFLSVTLSALSIMITILGLFVAVLGVIGWTTFESKIRDNSLSYLASELSKDGKLRKEFEQILTEMSLQGVQTSDSIENSSGNNKSEEAPYSD